MRGTIDQRLAECHAVFIDICFGDVPMDTIRQWIHPKITGYGTNINEKVQDFQAFVDLLQSQRDQSTGLDIQIDVTPVSNTILAEHHAAVCVDEAILSMCIDGNPFQMRFRFSSVFEYLDDQWWVVHFHGSIPQGAVGEQDTWSANEWRQKNAELERIILERTEALRRSLEELKTTQAQLVHSEKMASLGELTAGIAHEIQNPLNFVNNFADLSRELAQELKTAVDADDPALARELAADLNGNLEKIHHHGQRAEAIVKSMLQHSRTNAGDMQLTDLNALADEYLRLAYHGMRARDKAFNARLDVRLDAGLQRLNLVPQDMGRVLLNLFSNAFYAVRQKQAHAAGGFEPVITLVTTGTPEGVRLEVADNGDGIPEELRDKIFQPFFTTKPSGEGTGLGLSLSYDIITKGHRGSLSVESRLGEFTKFTILLPYSSQPT